MYQCSIVSDRTDPDRMQHEMYDCLYKSFQDLAAFLMSRVQEGADVTLTCTITASRTALTANETKPGKPQSPTFLGRIRWEDGVYQLVQTEYTLMH